ncbi:lipopolysaccharide biosynthesis protein [Acinetobacter sp. ANC 3813]|uniref:lipopolysaccharide biosynthesis protein n=1 Tax=Acinetobacter sp. ANC 3813 TaxID=1977873 RepID=UPI000A33EA30|nr:lipopolysaccharide biosynthesis protein [Acinetobacter sp. ANC 3813]OTG88655.1 hypothetical protein B9T34_15005 [Acinetobacter sp. ANC 3813]
MTEKVSRSDLGKKAVKSGALTMVAQLIKIALQLASIIILSRLLSPDDFGLIAMVVVITSFMQLFRDMGLSTASIQKGDLTYDQTNALFWLNVAVGGLLTIITMLCAPLISWFYERPELQAVLMVLSSTFLISSAGAQHSALMQRELRFKPKVLADIAGAVATLVVSIVMAICGYGFWALAWGTVIGAIITTVMYFFGSKFRPSRPKKTEGMRELIGFGANVTIFELVNYFHRNLDNILIGKVWGAVTLGLYSRGYQMMMLPIASLRQPINSVAYPVLSKLQNEPIAFRAYYQKIATLLAFLSMPLMAFLVVNASNVVTVAMGKGWEQLVPIFVLLGISGFIQPVGTLRGLVLLSLGKSRLYVLWGVVNAIVVSIAFIIGVRWSAEGVAAAYAIANYLLIYPSLYFFFKDTPVNPSDFFSSIAIPAIASIVAAALMHWVQLYWMTDINQPLMHLLISGLMYLILFVMVVLVLPKGRNILQQYLKIIGTIVK